MTVPFPRFAVARPRAIYTWLFCRHSIPSLASIVVGFVASLPRSKPSGDPESLLAEAGGTVFEAGACAAAGAIHPNKATPARRLVPKRLTAALSPRGARARA